VKRCSFSDRGFLRKETCRVCENHSGYGVFGLRRARAFGARACNPRLTTSPYLHLILHFRTLSSSHFHTPRLRTTFNILFPTITLRLHGSSTLSKNLRAGHSPLPQRSPRAPWNAIPTEYNCDHRQIPGVYQSAVFPCIGVD
jgi:hypothetical protein